MKIRHVGPQKSIRILAVGILICWSAAGNASEQWDAKASARVNLRRNPNSNGVILSIVPQGHKVRIMEKDGLWYKVDVEGDIHGKGWVYAEYLEKILPKAQVTESAAQTVRVEIASGEPEQGIHPAEPPPKARTEGEPVKPLRAPLPGKTSIAVINEQSSARNELRETKIETGVLSKVEIFEPEEPVHMPPAEPRSSGFKQDAPGISEKSSSELIERGNVSLHQKNLPDREKKQEGAVPETPSLVGKKAMTDVGAVAASIESPAVFHETKGLINRRESLGPIETTLKLLAIALSCLVILFLHRANKIATNHYNALMQFQHSPEARQ